MRGPEDTETGDQVMRLSKVLYEMIHHRHFVQKQRWMELQWQRLLDVAHAMGPRYYPWESIPAVVKHHLKNHLLSTGYGVTIPVEPFHEEGILISWRVERFQK